MREVCRQAKGETVQSSRTGFGLARRIPVRDRHTGYLLHDLRGYHESKYTALTLVVPPSDMQNIPPSPRPKAYQIVLRRFKVVRDFSKPSSCAVSLLRFRLESSRLSKGTGIQFWSWVHSSVGLQAQPLWAPQS